MAQIKSLKHHDLLYWTLTSAMFGANSNHLGPVSERVH